MFKIIPISLPENLLSNPIFMLLIISNSIHYVELNRLIIEFPYQYFAEATLAIAKLIAVQSS